MIKLATDTIDEVRKRVSKTALGRRGTTKDPVWSYRNLFLTGAERLSDKQRHRLEQILTDHDPTGELRHVWQAKERLRDLMHCPPDHHRIRQRLCTFYEACAEADMPELTRLATTIDEWWPAILTAIQTGITNARTEGLNRIVKQVKRIGCSFTNMDNYHRRVKLVIAANRPHQQPA